MNPEAAPKGLAWLLILMRWFLWWFAYYPTFWLYRRVRATHQGFRRWRIRNRLLVVMRRAALVAGSS